MSATPAPSPTQPLATAAAPGKVILVGEHAVVHGQPAIALPLAAVGARATIRPIRGEFTIAATDLGNTYPLGAAGPADVLAAAVHATLGYLRLDEPPAWRLELTSTVPMGAGLGSSAAVAVATVRAVLRAARVEIAAADVARLAWEAERVVHGNSSGVDPTVVALAHPIWYQNGAAADLAVGDSFDFVVADSGQPGDTAAAVARVASSLTASAASVRAIMSEIGSLAGTAARCLAQGNPDELGPLLDQNHELLRALGVSTPRLDGLVAAARAAGALGAKLTGAGGGGAILALVAADELPAVSTALLGSGARAVYTAKLAPSPVAASPPTAAPASATRATATP